MNNSPLVLVTGRVPPDTDPDRAEWIDPWRDRLTVLPLVDIVSLSPETREILGGAERLLILPTPDLSGELIHFFAGWGLARTGQALWLDGSGFVPLPGLTPCIDKTALYSELSRWEKERKGSDAAGELRTMGYWAAPDYFLKAVQRGDEKAVGLFMISGQNPDQCDDKGIPALCLAARAGHTAVCRMLLESGCDKNAVAPDRNNNALMDAAAEGNAELAKLLVDAGTELDRQSKNDQTALMLAVGINNPAITALLLDAGANTTLKDVLGMTACQYGKILGFGQIVALFEKKGVTE